MNASARRFMTTLRAHARERADGARALEAQLRKVPPSAATVDGLVAALEAQRSAAQTGAAAPRRRPWRKGRWAAALVPLAAAAAFALGVGRAGPPANATADYVVSVTGHVQTERGAHDPVFSTLEARADVIEQVIVRPKTRVAARVAARVLVVRDGVGVPVGVVPEVSELGVIRFDMPGAALLGASEARVVIAPAPALDEATAAAAKAPAATLPSGATLVRIAVEALDASEPGTPPK